MLRKTKDGRIFEWKVEKDAPPCTLQEAFEKVDRSVGFNVELKFDDQLVYTQGELTRVLEAILKVHNYNFFVSNTILLNSTHIDYNNINCVKILWNR